MCTELILAIIYFLAIFLANYFLFKIIENLLQSFFYYLKIEMIFKKWKSFSKKETLFFCIQGKKIPNPSVFLNLLPNLETPDDSLLLGQIYELLLKKNSFQKTALVNPKSQENAPFLSNQMYLTLVKKQYRI